MSNSNEFPNLKRNPIQAAIFEVRHLISGTDFAISFFLELHSLIKDKYPTLQKGHHPNIHIEQELSGKAKATVKSNNLEEVRFISSDKKRILLINAQVFNLNFTEAYVNWDDYFNEFSSIWEQFYNLIISKYNLVIIGASVRYINRIMFKEFISPTNYFKTTIYADEGVVKGEVASYIMRYIVNKKDLNIQIHITQELENLLGDQIPYLFDIDVIYDKVIQRDDIWQIFDQLHFHKNDTFFSNLTDETLKMLI